MEKVLEQYLKKAIELNSDYIEVEYKDYHEEIIAVQGSLGLGIGRIKSSSSKGKKLLTQLHEIVRKKIEINLDGHNYEISAKSYDSFGEAAFKVKISLK
jgi:hypothetical protein